VLMYLDLQVIRSASFESLRLKQSFPHMKEMLLRQYIRWICLVKEKVFFFACKRKLMVQISRINLVLYQVKKRRILIDGYQIPLDFKNGLAYLRSRKPTEDELVYCRL
jgi:hypothetical protein